MHWQVLEKYLEETVLEVFKALDISSFRTVELAFIKEYCTVMQPLAYALDILQGKCFMGFLLPTLVLRTKLTALRPDLKLTHPLVDAILTIEITAN